MPLTSPRKSFWKWGVCGLLLLATTINYMDRMTFTQSSKRIMAAVDFDEEGYGNLEAYFGIAFATGSLLMGLLVDRVNVYWVYPTTVVLWSFAGAATGRARTFEELAACRILLGFFEAANWPCALRTTQRLLEPDQRALGNGILQSGAALGAIVTPLVVQLFLWRLDDWRPSFYVVGATGLFWAALWLGVVRARDLSLTNLPTTDRPADASFWPALRAIGSDRRFWVLAVVVVCINLTWHFFRAWMPLFLQNARGYSEINMNVFSSGYYLSADAGSWSAGFLALFLFRRGLSVHASRLSVFFVFALVALLGVPAAFLPRGPLLLIVLLVIGFASLGLFPNYYSFSQELTTRHQGKVTGMLGCFCWVAMFFMQSGVGRYVKETGQFTLGVALAGIPPLIGFAALFFFWKRGQDSESSRPSNAGAASVNGAPEAPADRSIAAQK